MSNALSILTGGKKPAPKDAERTSVALEKIRTDGGTQPRAVVDPGASAAYAEDMKADLWDWDRHELPVVFFDGTDYWLASGFHRREAVEITGHKTMPCEVRQGTRRDAVLFSVGTNLDHGLRRTNGDKRRAVVTLLQDDEWRAWADREIARRCAVDHTFVARIRKELYPADTGPRNVTRGGTTYQQKPPIKAADPDLASVEIKTDESGQTSFAPAPEPPAQPEPEPGGDHQAESHLDPINPQEVYLVGESMIYLPGFASHWEASTWLNDHTELNPLIVPGSEIWGWPAGKSDSYRFEDLPAAASADPAPASAPTPVEPEAAYTGPHVDGDLWYAADYVNKKLHGPYPWISDAEKAHTGERMAYYLGRRVLELWKSGNLVGFEVAISGAEAAPSAEAPAEQPAAGEPDDLDLVRDEDIALAIDDLEIALAQLSIAAQQGVLGDYIKRQRASLNETTVTTLALLFEEVDNALRV